MFSNLSFMDFHHPTLPKVRRWSGFIYILGIAGEQSFILTLTIALQEVTITATADLFHLLAEKKVCHKSELKSTCVKNGRNEKLSNKLFMF